ncbi:MAG: bifunctional metallophosphatase/5'-nucleotidase [Methanotrichaceae archaeon]|nr:bifunctional metallophosphatase/5'-nucleotidase [Methanotrichaceae archaeon]
MKYSLILVISIIFVSTAVSLNPLSVDRPKEIAIMTTSDLQSQVAPFNDSPETSSVGGLSQIAAAAKNISAQSDGSLLFSSGDDLMGSFYSTFKGVPEMVAMTMANYSAITPGNHEFDFGWEAYLNATKYAGFPIISTNLEIQNPDLRAVIRPNMILNVTGINVGIFGLMTPELLKITNAGEGISVNQSYEEIAKEQVKILQDHGANLIVALSHMGSKMDTELAKNVSGIDLIVGGHDHIYLNDTIEGPSSWKTIIVQDGMEGERLGVLHFTYNGSGIENPIWETISISEGSPKDPAIEDYLAPYLQQYDTKLADTIGYSEVDLDAMKKNVRSQEMPIGNLIVDSWRKWFSEAQIAVINGGSIRGDRIYPQGNISYQTLNTMLPFHNNLILATMTGTEIKQMLEISASALGPNSTGIPDGGFLQVNGIRFSINMGKEAFSALYDGRQIKQIINSGNRVSDIFVMENNIWRPLDDKKIYFVLTNDYLSEGGDGYALLADLPANRKRDTTMVDLDPVAKYISENSPVAPKVEGRIEIMD